MKRVLLWVFGGLGAILVLLGLLWFGYNLYVERVVAANPATQEVVSVDGNEYQLGAYSGGDQVLPASPVPVEPTASVDQAPSSTPLAEPTSPAQPTPAATPAAAQATPTPRPILPPTKLTIPRFKLAIPVVLADNENLPKFKAAGWFLGTGYPGFRGNVVLFGHLNGDYETFGRLHELTAGDEVVVRAVDRDYHYRVSASKVVPSSDLKVLAPTGDFRLTLITCTGTFIPQTRDYTHRLIVTASLIPQALGS